MFIQTRIVSRNINNICKKRTTIKTKNKVIACSVGQAMDELIFNKNSKQLPKNAKL